MFQLLYASRETRPLGPEDITSILQESRRTNARLGVTGVLTYANGEFLQVLEGREAIVRALYGVIHRDRRHTSCTVLIEQPVDRREFNGWSMGWYEPPADSATLVRHLGIERLDRAAVERMADDPTLCRSVLYGLVRIATVGAPSAEIRRVA